CYRAYYAIRRLANTKGQPTNAVYGFITMLMKLVKDRKPDYLGVAFDLKGPTFRHQRYDDYKITRKPMPDDLVSQMPIIKEVVRAYNIPLFEMSGYEADDILATLATAAQKSGIDTMIVTGDKDALQLVNDHIKVYNTHKDGLIFDEHKVEEEFKVPPAKMIDLMGLMGDATDNIPGVTGIGEKTAIQLLAQFGSLDTLFENLDQVTSDARRELLKKYEAQARMSRELALLDRAVPIAIDFDLLKAQEPDMAKLAALFRELEFKALLDQVTERKELDADYTLISSAADFEKFYKELLLQEIFAFDFETTGTDALVAAPVGVSFCWEEGRAVYLNFIAGELVAAEVLAKLKPVFENAAVRKIGQNIKYEMKVLAHHGIALAGVSFDTMVASYLLDPARPNHNLGVIALEYLDHKMMDITELIGKGKDQITMDRVPVTKVCAYCCEDSDVTFRLKNILEKELRAKGLIALFDDVEIPLIGVLARMELAGVSIDVEYLTEMSRVTEKKLDTLTKTIYEIAGTTFNINSPKQLQEILFVRLQLTPVKKTKTGFSTDEEVLEKLSSKHPLPRTILEYRELAKLKSTYMDTLPKLINPATQRLHASFNQTVTSTGRLSSSEPNLQNIPIKTEIGRQIRRAFVPRDAGSYILSADYSQIDLRVLAHLSGDPVLIQAFKDELDIHRFTASLIFNEPEVRISDEQRSQAKTVNFGIIYGMSAYGLSKDLGIPVDQAQVFIDAYFARYPKVRGFIDTCVREAREKGFVTTLLNRRRYIPEIKSENINLRNFAERTAMNAPIQGSAADIIKIAMIGVDRELAATGSGAVMILQVHDELVLEVPGREMKATVELVRRHMERVMDLAVPLTVNISVGRNWLELEESA
ncbi:MAG: DNA polymerase I, partial [Candidatus Omnitrophota bacterium]